MPIMSPLSKDTITPVERSEETPLTDLEVRLDTSRAIDLFTMKPKVRIPMMKILGKPELTLVLHSSI